MLNTSIAQTYKILRSSLYLLPGLISFIVLSAPLPAKSQTLPGLDLFNPGNPSCRGDNTPYTLGSGDRVQLDIFNVPEYSGENGQFQVLADGSLNLPLVGKVTVEGLTLQQAGALISQSYDRFLQRPELLTVSLLERRPLQIGIGGEVNRPGSYTMSVIGRADSEEATQIPTITGAIQRAGGITQAANITQIELRRKTGSVCTVNLSTLISQGSLQEDISLRDGDTIFIPTSTTVDPVATTQLATTSLAGQATQPINIIVVGEVTRPGAYTVTRVDEKGSLLTVTRALQTAGGINLSSDIRQIQVIRRPKTSNEPIPPIQVNLWQLLQGDRTQDIVLQEGDTIVVPTATNPNPAEVAQIASANFAANFSQPLNIAVVGEVNRPGTYTIAGSDVSSSGNREILEGPETGGQLVGLPTVTRALKIAGGISPSANIRQIQVRRQTKAGTEQILVVDLWQLLQEGDLSQDTLLQQGDTIVVPTATNIDLAEAPQVAAASFSPNTIQVNIVGEVVNPGSVTLAPNSSLNQAILASGGFNNRRADEDEVELIRLNPNGTVSREKIPIDFAQGLDEETNPTLRNNDVIVVGRSGFAKTTDTIGTVFSPVFSAFGVFRFLNVLF
jgi:polysaccharide export outer membrane protein